jgi:hypothetical protein
LPLKLVMALAGGATVKATVFLTDAFMAVRDTLGEATVFTRIWDTLTGYARVLQTILGAFLSVLPSASESPALFGIAVAVALSSVLLIVRFVRKRSSNNASVRS